LTDKDIRSALLQAGIPRRYHGKYRAVNETGYGDTIRQWIRDLAPFVVPQYTTEEDDIKGLFFYGDAAIDALYLTARGLLVSGISAKVFTLPDLFDIDLRETARDMDNLVVGIVGYNEEGIKYPGDQERIYAVQWWITKLINAGKVMLLQGEHEPEIDKDWWGRGLSRLVKRTSTILEC